MVFNLYEQGFVSVIYLGPVSECFYLVFCSPVSMDVLLLGEISFRTCILIIKKYSVPAAYAFLFLD
jgi:hypothetical protein